MRSRFSEKINKDKLTSVFYYYDLLRFAKLILQKYAYVHFFRQKIHIYVCFFLYLCRRIC